MLLAESPAHSFGVHGRAILGVIGQGTLVVTLVVVAFGLHVGHLL